MLMRQKTSLPGWTVAIAVALTGLMYANSNTADSTKDHFTAFAVDVSNTAPRANTTNVDIIIDRYSPDADRDRLLEALDQGQDQLLKVLQNMPVIGHLTTPGSIGYDIHFARQHPSGDGGRTITVMTDRRIGFWEAANQPRSIDYPFTLIQLQLDKDNKGVGKASIATKITKDGKTIELENFSSEPVRLTEVREANK
jgi:hypothetical protein